MTQRENAEYKRSPSKLTIGSKMLSDMEKLAEKVYTYKPYLTYSDFSYVAEALTRNRLCLREPVFFNESYGWKQRLGHICRAHWEFFEIKISRRGLPSKEFKET